MRTDCGFSHSLKFNIDDEFSWNLSSKQAKNDFEAIQSAIYHPKNTKQTILYNWSIRTLNERNLIETKLIIYLKRVSKKKKIKKDEKA